MTRCRADVLLVDRGLFGSREQARAAILAGEVRIGDRTLAKAGELVESDSEFAIAKRQRFVSRGGDKLHGALERFGLDVTGRFAVDVGASTGGFTDCLLQAGVASVTAVDVGYGQLAWSLRTDPRVTVLERTNIRSVDPAQFDPFDLAVVDVSFISLAVVLPKVRSLLGPRSDLLALVKPQFEAGKGRVGKRGVVRDPALHAEVIDGVLRFLADVGLTVRGVTWSPLRGPEGNIEFWIWAATHGPALAPDVSDVVNDMVRQAHEALGG